MASMVQIFPPHDQHREQYNYNEGYASSAALISSHFAFNGAPPAAALLPACNDHTLLNGGVAASMWEANKMISPHFEGPFTPVPLSSSACPQQNIDHSSYMEAITRSCINADLLSFHNTASFDIDFPLAEENQLIELMGLQRKLSMYSSFAGADDNHDLSHEESMAAAEDEQESFLQARSYGDEEKMGNLARSFTFPPAGAARSVTISSCAASSPLILSTDAEIGNPNNLEKHFNHQLLHRENSSAATTSCSNGDEGERTGKDAGLKIEGMEVSHCMLGHEDQQEQIGTTLGSRGYKQSKKRSANMGNSNASVKAARLDMTPPDVVHVRARRGQATDSHSLAERVRREKISQRMKVLQEIVPGCHKVLGKAMMLDEIINYVKSLQKQVEFLSMKLAAANQAGMASMIANEVKFLLPNMEFLGDLKSSFQVIKSEPHMHSLTQL